MEDRIENVITREIEECRQAEGEFYTVTMADDSTYEVLAETCELEPSEVEMINDWRGIIRTGPVVWTAEEDEELGAVVLERVAWDDLDGALSSTNASHADVESYETAEEHFAEAQQQYGDSVWLRLERLDNLLKLRAERRQPDEQGDLLGEQLQSYVDETLQWADERDDRDTQAKVRLAVIDHFEDYIANRDDAIDRLGSRDDHMRSRAEAVEEQGDTEEAEEIRQDLQERIERRPERREEIEGRRENARRQACEFVDALSVDGVEDGQLRSRISSTLTGFDCDFSPSENDDSDSEEP